MKRGILAKFAFILIGLVVIGGYGQEAVTVSAWGCNTSQVCETWYVFWCDACGDGDCSGCFVSGGTNTCGVCSNNSGPSPVGGVVD